MAKPKEQRVEVLIDVQNLYHSAKNLYHSKVNFKEILKQAIAERKFIRAFAYVVRTKTGTEEPFFEALTKLGIETKTKDLQIFHTGTKKGDWDVGLAVEGERLADRERGEEEVILQDVAHRLPDLARRRLAAVEEDAARGLDQRGH